MNGLPRVAGYSPVTQRWFSTVVKWTWQYLNELYGESKFVINFAIGWTILIGLGKLNLTIYIGLYFWWRPYAPTWRHGTGEGIFEGGRTAAYCLKGFGVWRLQWLFSKRDIIWISQRNILKQLHKWYLRLSCETWPLVPSITISLIFNLRSTV